jgi:hypothetical protein
MSSPLPTPFHKRLQPSYHISRMVPQLLLNLIHDIPDPHLSRNALYMFRRIEQTMTRKHLKSQVLSQYYLTMHFLPGSYSLLASPENQKWQYPQLSGPVPGPRARMMAIAARVPRRV